MSDNRSQRLVWIDLEMTGLDLAACSIIEIASVVTDADLNIIANGPQLVIHQSDELLEAMDEWNTSHHGKSGLTEAVRASTVTLAEAETATLEFLGEHVRAGISPLCGNSIGNDRRFLEKEMPLLATFFHYRNIDVSTIKELARRWYGPKTLMDKSGGHRAQDDILESIAELQHFRNVVFREK